MPAAPMPPDEPARLAVLQALQILDTPDEPLFDQIVSLTRNLGGTETALISLLDGERQWFKARAGLAAASTPRDHAFCGYTILSDDVLWVEDAALDERFRDNPLVTSDPYLRFYAGAPLVVDGARLGALCLIDPKPRPFDAAVARRLSEVAALVSSALQQRAVSRQLEEALSYGVVRQAPVSTIVADRTFRIAAVSARLEEEYLIDQHDVVGRPILDVFPEADRYRQEQDRALAGERIVVDGAEIRRGDGSVMVCRWEMGPWRDGAGVIRGLRVMTTDLTEQRRATEALRRSEERLTLALEVSNTIVWELSLASRRLELSGRLASVSDRLVDFKDIARDPMIIVHPLDRPWVEPIWRRFTRDGRPYRVEHRVLREDDAEVWVESNAELFAAQDGRPERVIGSLRNITEKKVAALNLAAARESAEAANRVKSEFLANMSHELRTPLNGVLGVASTLAASGLDPRQRDQVALIEESATTLKALLSDLLDVARIESDGLQLQIEPFDLAELVEAVCRPISLQASSKGVGFVVEHDRSKTGRFRGDAQRVSQLLANLLSNAVKFTERGEVRLIVETWPGAGEDEAQLRFTVQDTGVGFSPEVAGRLFRRFEQADSSMTRRYGGSGLGLAICRSLADAMGATLEAESEPGRGSRFTLALQLPRIAAAPRPGDVDDAAREPLRMRVLLAEDHPINRRVVELVLGGAGIDLTSVVDGAEAVRAHAELAPFDLILMDMQMPVMDGLTATRTIRAREREQGLAPTAIVMLTANAMAEHVSASLAAGADEHAAKPITASELLGLVHRACQAGGNGQEPPQRQARG